MYLIGISKFQVESLHSSNLEDAYLKLKELVNSTDSLNLKFETSDKNYYLVASPNNRPFSLNFFIDDFYFEKESNEELKTFRNSVLKLILATLKKYKTRLKNINEKLETCNNMDTYRLYGELITANLYRISNRNSSEIKLENYYDNNNLITIPLDSKYLPSINAKRYFKKYNKLKNALKIVGKQKEDTINELNYIESIVYELEAANSIDEISEIFEEISENVIFENQTNKYKNKKNKKSKVKKSSLTKNKNVQFNPHKYFIDGFTFLVGRNNKENDYLTTKYAKKSDLWFHTKDIHGSHGILVLNGNVPGQEILVKCSQIVAYNSKARLSSNVPVDFCEVRYVKKPNGSKPGMVIYTNNSTLYVTPNNK